MKQSRLTAAAVVGILTGALALVGPTTGFARDGYRTDTQVTVGYREHDGRYDRHHDSRDRHRHYRKHDHRGHHAPRGHAYGHRHSQHRPYYYAPRHYSPRYYDDSRGYWDFILRYHFTD